MSTPQHDDDTARDARLAAALRHAPDAEAGAPFALSAAIRRSARQAVEAGASAARPKGMAAWRRALPLGASGAFATLLIASVVAWMWRGDAPPPMAEAVPERVSDSAASSPSGNAVALAPAPASTGAAPPAAPIPTSRRSSGPPTATPSPPPMPPAAPAPQAADATQHSTPAPGARSEDAHASAKARADAAAEALPLSAPPAAARAPALTAWPDALAAAAHGALRLHAPQGPDATAWLQQLRSATAGRWHAVDASAAGAPVADAATAALLLYDDRGPIARLRLDLPDGVLACRVDTADCRRAALDGTALRALREAVPRN